jgi:hypothetical protein
MQRLYEDDLTMHLLKKGGWRHLNLPVVAEMRTVIDFGRIQRVPEVGGLLHPEREGPEEIERMKQELGSYASPPSISKRRRRAAAAF